MVLVVFFSHHGVYQIYRFRHERLRLEQENFRLAAENARLARTIDRLQNDPVLIQDLIRQELNFVKRNEIIFQFPPASPAMAQDTASVNSSEAPAGARVQTLSAGKVEKSKWVSPPPDGPKPKRAGHRRE